MTTTNAAIQTIVNEIAKALEDSDEKDLERDIAWALERKQALADYKKTPEYEALRRDQWALYDKLWAIAGGKGWYTKLNELNRSQLIDFVTLNCKAKVDKRNVKIAKDLDKAGVLEVLSVDVKSTGYNFDNFDGIYMVQTNNGVKNVRITTIIAGGYNIQSLHSRVLVKVS